MRHPLHQATRGPQAPDEAATQACDEAAPSAGPQTLDALLLNLWRSSQSTILERLAALRAAQDAMLGDPFYRGLESPGPESPCSETLCSESPGAETMAVQSARKAAREVAHKLAGVLGTFGLPRGSELALQAQALLDLPPHPGDAATLGELLHELEALIQSKSQQ